MIQIKTERLSDITDEFLRRAKDSKGGNIQHKLLEKKRHAPQQQSSFWDFLKENLDKILIGNPYELYDLAAEIEISFRHKIKAKKGLSKLGKNLKIVFDYDGFSKNKNGGWNAYWLADSLGVDTCPYCNRLYTHTVVDNLQNISRPQFDHFMDKATHPYLAVSFYNLVPSCSVCNSNLKGKSKFSPTSHVHPYLEGFGELIKFNLRVKDCSFFNGNLESGVIEFINESTISEPEKELITKAGQNIKAFELKKMYEGHLDYAQGQVLRAMTYSPDYLDSLFRQFEGTLFRNREDLVQFITANYVDDENLHRRPLSKLTRDIAEQFGLWENPFEGF